MTEVIKISFPEVLEATLNKTKTTTLRKAWKPDTVQPEFVTSVFKPCKYEVGEEYPVVWVNEDFDIFDKSTGEGKYIQGNASLRFVEEWMEKNNYFGNPIGRVLVTKKEKVEIRKGNLGYAIYLKKNKETIAYHSTRKYAKQLSKSEGFLDVETMFKKIEEYAEGLEVPKPFHLATFKWL